jgi:hypothetical protein
VNGVEPGEVGVIHGGSLDLDCLLTVAVNTGEGPQSWSISVRHDPSVLELVEAGTAGTVVERVAAETSVFEVTELVDNETGTGFLSAVILGMDRPYSLPPLGQERIARVRYRVREEAAEGARAEVAYRDGLRQSGVPIQNLVVFPAGPAEPARGTMAVRVIAVGFARGDLNGDGTADLADAAAILSWLFRGDADPDCLDAADSNDDGGLDVADPVFLLRGLFMGERSPPPPFPAAGPDPTPDLLGCRRPRE